MPLNRSALEIVLMECVFDVPELLVIRAVESWCKSSPWVQATYNGASMQADQVSSLMDYTDPRCLTGPEFGVVDHLFSVTTQDLVRFLPLHVHVLQAKLCS
jgi:hypothetical protein